MYHVFVIISSACFLSFTSNIQTHAYVKHNSSRFHKSVHFTLEISVCITQPFFNHINCTLFCLFWWNAVDFTLNLRCGARQSHNRGGSDWVWLNYSQQYSGQVLEEYSKSNHLFVKMKRHGTTCQCLCVCEWVGVKKRKERPQQVLSAAQEHNKYRRIGAAGRIGVKWTARDLRKGRKVSDRSIIESNPRKEA